MFKSDDAYLSFRESQSVYTHKTAYNNSGGALGQSVEHATPGEEILGSIPCPLYYGLPTLSHVW